MSRRLVLSAAGATLDLKPADLAGVRELVVEAPQLTSLPAAIGKGADLKKIVIRGARLTALPDEIGQLAKLEWLDVRENRLKTLPASLAKCTKLATLITIGNKFEKLPDGIGALAKVHNPPIIDEDELSPWVTWQIERLGGKPAKRVEDVTFPPGTTLFYKWEGMRITLTWEPAGGKLGMDDYQHVYPTEGAKANPVVYRADHGRPDDKEARIGGEKLHQFLAKMKATVSRTKPDVAADRNRLCAAAAHGKLDTVEELLAKGVKPDGRGEDGLTPLEEAAYQLHEEIVARLLAAKANPNSKTTRDVDRGRDFWKGSTALHCAVGAHGDEAKRARIVRALLAAGADPDACGPAKMTALHILAFNTDDSPCALVADFAAKKADLNVAGTTRFWKKTTPLHIAAMGRPAMAKALVEAGAKTDLKDGHGKTPLDLATERKDAEIIKLLKKKK
jgi:ankyrin repeat protein